MNHLALLAIIATPMKHSTYASFADRLHLPALPDQPGKRCIFGVEILCTCQVRCAHLVSWRRWSRQSNSLPMTEKMVWHFILQPCHGLLIHSVLLASSRYKGAVHRKPQNHIAHTIPVFAFRAVIILHSLSCISDFAVDSLVKL